MKASRQQQLEAVAFAYSKSGGWWGQLPANAVLILSLSLWRAAILTGLLPRNAALVLDARLPRHPAGCIFAEGIDLTVMLPLARVGLPFAILVQRLGRQQVSHQGRN